MTSFTPDQVQRLETLLHTLPDVPPSIVTEEGITFLTSLTGQGPTILCTVDLLMALAHLVAAFHQDNDTLLS